MKKISAAFLGAFLFMWTAAHANITTVDGSQFKNVFETSQARLYLKGAALLRYLIFIDAYTGALYLPEKTDGLQALDDIPKHLVLEYRVAISAEDFSRATREKIRDSLSSEDFNRLLPSIEALNRLYTDVKPGDRYALTYQPGSGTRLILNSEPLGTIPGAEFARALFAIWIGSNPIDTVFRDKLLGLK